MLRFFQSIRPLGSWIATIALAVVLSGTSGCAHRPDQASSGKGAATTASYSVKGTVKEVALDRRSAIIRHQAIRGYMPAMTMEFTVLDPAELGNISPGDEINFRLVVSNDSHWIDTIRTTRSTQSPSTPSPAPAAAGKEIGTTVPIGTPLPDGELLSESGQPLRLSDFRGQALALTFVFSRCPLPDFCPRMSRHFFSARAILQHQVEAPTNWHFLSISFDPEFDKPDVLTRYARSYRGENSRGWTFAAASTNTLESLKKTLGLVVSREGGSFNHNLRTVVLDPKGQLYQRFIGNQWTPRELAESLTSAARLTTAR